MRAHGDCVIANDEYNILIIHGMHKRSISVACPSAAIHYTHPYLMVYWAKPIITVPARPGFESSMSNAPHPFGLKRRSGNPETALDGIVIGICTLVVLVVFGLEAHKAVDRTERLEAFYDQLQQKSPLHRAFIDRYRRCAPDRKFAAQAGPASGCLSDTVQAMLPLKPEAAHLFQVEQDVRLGEQAIYAQNPSTFLNGK